MLTESINCVNVINIYDPSFTYSIRAILLPGSFMGHLNTSKGGKLDFQSSPIRVAEVSLAVAFYVPSEDQGIH